MTAPTSREELLALADRLAAPHMNKSRYEERMLNGDERDLIVAALRGAAQPSDSEEVKLTYIKRWRTLVKLPAKYADEIVEALRAPAQASWHPLSEEERHAVEHARYQVAQASMVNPDCCFDYDLVKDLIRAIDRAYSVPSTERCQITCPECGRAAEAHIICSACAVSRPDLPFHDETMAALSSLTIRPSRQAKPDDCDCVGAVIGQHDRSCALSRPQSQPTDKTEGSQ